MAIDLEASLEEQCEAIWQATLEAERRDWEIRNDDPLVKLADGNQVIRHLLLDYHELSFKDIENDTGSCTILIDADHYVAEWVLDQEGRRKRGEGTNLHIEVEVAGVRWSGRAEPHDVEEGEDGRRYLRLTFLHEYENLKWIDCWSNPFLPAIFQFPRIFILAGPAIWTLKTALFLNLWRLFSGIWQIPDDPMDPSTWLDGLNMSTWDIVVNPTTFFEDMAAGTQWAVFASRWGTWHDIAAPILADAELTVVTRRWRTGDPDPWLGANIKDGALVVDIVDKSGAMTGTAHGGTMFDGLFRTIREFTADFLDTTESLLTDSPTSDLYVPGRGTKKAWPHVYFPNDSPAAVSKKFTQGPSKGVIINTGGHSFPGVNETMSAGIQAIGDIVGNALQIGSIGGSIDTILKPFYEDTVAAWVSVKIPPRIAAQGKSRYWEKHIESAGKAYTLSTLMVIRQAMYETRSFRSASMQIKSAEPYVAGWPGTGDFWVGDRLITDLEGISDELIVERVSQMEYTRKRGDRGNFGVTVGPKQDEDPAVAMAARLEKLNGIAKTLGVF
ncbi:Gp37-like protein [Rhodococcus pyridinivorans]|uniref:Gp28/Gp37-like domain-containing protein n=1 Tax=Rhodococcus pyridinivorans AK37 TaxID=1114960 RepID=H0JL44_9NOCA|nr:hypothetical protein [Rhodococcus pyridinivorans]EHK86379.1 hypothetical protein AK37_01487 [Rhodococcus pyridinivorans AK37]MCD2139531.1 hypothetical protein [Rhodococcus pyridinivorans]